MMKGSLPCLISLDKKLILPMFQLDALVLLMVNEAKLWGTSIHSYVKACWHALLLIAHVKHSIWLSNLRCCQVNAGYMLSKISISSELPNECKQVTEKHSPSI